MAASTFGLARLLFVNRLVRRATTITAVIVLDDGRAAEMEVNALTQAIASDNTSRNNC